MSALLNNISFRPSIIGFNNIEDIINKIFDGNKEAQLTKIRNVSGSLSAYKIPNQLNAKLLWEQGEKPKLI